MAREGEEIRGRLTLWVMFVSLALNAILFGRNQADGALTIRMSDCEAAIDSYAVLLLESKADRAALNAKVDILIAEMAKANTKLDRLYEMNTK